MNDFISVKEASVIWSVTERQVSKLCKDGKIAGAQKKDGKWMIPSNAEKPSDRRLKSGKYQKKDNNVRLPLPIGVSSYSLASSEYYYIDKTLMIKDFIDEKPMVTLFTRPRRFGKTLNMDMIRTFFEKSKSDTSVFFRNRKIWACGKKYQEYQGKYPVIFLTFKDIKFDTWEETFFAIRNIFAREVQRHKEILQGNSCDEFTEKLYGRLASGECSEVELSSGLLDLSSMLHAHYGIPPVIIIDEYDTPIQQGHMKGYYDTVISFMRNLFSGGFKDNPHLSYGFLTGILRVAKESIFSGMNNLSIHSVLDEKYSEYFGFTPKEVRQMADYYGKTDKYQEICNWYDGYRFGNTEIFNPWSVVNYFSNDCDPRPYWVSTGSNDIIGEVLANADQEIYEKLTSLIKGQAVVTFIDTSVIYPEISKNPSTIYSFLLVAGYLKVLKKDTAVNGDMICEVAIPNREIALVYNKEILNRMRDQFPETSVISIQEALFLEDRRRLKEQFQFLQEHCASYFDTVGENFYQGFILGLCALISGVFVTSNRESGEGRYDIQLKPLRKNLPGILIELKAGKKCSETELKRMSEMALKQIRDRKYDEELIRPGIQTVYCYGVAFSGKRVEVSVG